MEVRAVEHLLRPLAPQVLGALVRRHGRFDECEDAVQEALLAAIQQWPGEGVPSNPAAWLTTVASRRLADHARSEIARRRREEADAALASPGPPIDADDMLTLLFLCCHPSLTPTSQIALTLRAVGGLTTAEIAGAFLVPEPTMGQRISRAKQRIAATGARFGAPDLAERDDRLRAVLHALYLIFNEGYTASSGVDLRRDDLTTEAMRLTRDLHRLLPDDGEVAGLLALMLLTEARRAARVSADRSLAPLAEQDRSLWDQAMIGEGVALVSAALATRPLGPYQVQAAIAAVHDEAATPDDTDWPQILALYEVLERLTPNPIVTLNRAVAVAMVHGPQAGLAVIDGLEHDSRVRDSHRLLTVRAHLLEMSGDREAALALYREAARRTLSLPERRHLEARARHLAERPPDRADDPGLTDADGR